MPTPNRAASSTQKTYKSSTLNSHLNKNNLHSTPIEDNIEVQKCKNSDSIVTSHTLNENINTLTSSSSVESEDAIKENILPPNNWVTDMTDQVQSDDLVEFRVEKVQALYDYNPIEDDELGLVKG